MENYIDALWIAAICGQIIAIGMLFSLILLAIEGRIRHV